MIDLQNLEQAEQLGRLMANWESKVSQAARPSKVGKVVIDCETVLAIDLLIRKSELTSTDLGLHKTP